MSRDEEKNERIIRLIAEQIGVSEYKVRSRFAQDGLKFLGVDSLDVAELVMELDDELPDDTGHQP